MGTPLQICGTGKLCDCTERRRDCPVSAEDRRFAAMSPEQAIVAMSKSEPNGPLLYYVAKAVLVDSRYVNPDTARAYLSHIRSSQRLENRAHWDYSVFALTKLFYSTVMEPKNKSTAEATLQVLNQAYPEVIDAIHNDFFWLQEPGERGDSTRCSVAKFLTAATHSPTIKKLAYEDGKTLKIALQCWLDTSPDCYVRKDSCTPVWNLMQASDMVGGKNPTDRTRLAAQAVKPSHVTSKMNYVLKTKALMGENLSSDIRVFWALISSPEPFLPAFLEGNLPKQVALALKREFRTQRGSNAIDDHSTGKVLASGEAFFDSVLHGSRNTMVTFTNLVETTCLIEVAALAFARANRLRIPWEARGRGTFYWFLYNVCHCLQCVNYATCKFHATEEFREAVRAALERVTLPTLALLEQHNPGPGNKYIAFWKGVSANYRIDDNSIRERHIKDEKCCNVRCPTRAAGVHLPRKSRCSGCQMTFYCSRECQKSDWKTHKEECAVMRDRRTSDGAI